MIKAQICPSGDRQMQIPKADILAFAVAILTIFSLWADVQAQDFDHFKPLQSTGSIPEELRTASSKKYARDLAQLGDSARGKAGRARDNFLLQSNFALDDLLLSGRVIFNDPVSEYVSRVKSLILRNNPELDKKIRIYIVKSPVVNAFATNSGILLVNMGLLAHLKNEAELAFILCHEIQHFVRKHPINNYVKAEEIKSNAKLLGLNTVEDYIAARTGYSRRLELEADDLGYQLYRTSGYSLSAADGVFDLLENAERPFDEIPWDDSFFEWEFMRFPAEFTKWPLEEVAREEDENDTLSTHPSIAKRRTIIAEQVKAEKEDVGEVFIVGPEVFLNVRKICRFELSELYLAQHAFEEAIYNSYLLLQEEPESHYLRKNIAQAIYGLCVFHNSRKFWNTHIDDDDVPGEIQQLLYFTESMDGEAFTIFALHEVWKTYLRYPDDEELDRFSKDLLRLLFKKHYDTAGWLETELPKTMPEPVAKVIAEKLVAIENRDSILIPKKEGDEELDDHELEVKEQNQRYRKERADKNEYMKWAITDLFQKNLFADAWNERVRAGKVVKNAEEDEPDESEMRLEGVRLGIDKIVMVQPIYKEVDLRSKIPVQYLASEASMLRYKSTIADLAQRNGISLTFLENRSLEEGDVQTFNDVATMANWFNHYLSEEDAEVEIENFSQGEVHDLIERYGTKYFAWNALITVTTRLTSTQKAAYILVGLVYLPALPFLIVKVAKPIKKTMFVTLVFDLESSEVVMENYRILKAKDKQGITKATLYDTFYQIKQDPK
jgi:Zn-dependent protease with chaperone function